jgi:hypothetical protein
MLTPLKKNKGLLLAIGVALVAFLLGLFGNTLLSPTGGGLSGAAGAMSNQAACDTTVLSSKDPTGIVLADPLNLRTGPGLNYQVITMLEVCKPVGLLGRTSDYAWLEVSLPGNVGGWVFAGYIQANTNLSNLKVTTASGGPAPGNAGSGSSNGIVSVIIQANQVAAFISGMPANTIISATLRPSSGSGKGLAVASGQTDAQGNATLTFPMPATWADGSAVTSGTMTLTLTGGGDTLTAWLTYYTN